MVWKNREKVFHSVENFRSGPVSLTAPMPILSAIGRKSPSSRALIAAIYALLALGALAML